MTTNNEYLLQSSFCLLTLMLKENKVVNIDVKVNLVTRRLLMLMESRMSLTLRQDTLFRIWSDNTHRTQFHVYTHKAYFTNEL